MKFLNSYLFQLAVISALIYATADFLDIPLKHYILLGFLAGFNPSIGESIQESSKIIMGIFAGGFIAFIVLIAFPQNSFSVGIAIFFTILFCYFLNIPQAILNAVICACMVSIGHYADGLNQYYWQRFVFNSIGVILGGIITFLIPPPSSVLKLEKGLGQTLISLQNLYEKIIARNLNYDSTVDFQEIENLNQIISEQIASNNKLLSLAKIEISQGLSVTNELENIEKQNNLIQEIAFTLKEMSMEKVIDNQEHKLYQKLYLEIANLTQITSENLNKISNLSFKKNLNNQTISLPDLTLAMNSLGNKINSLRETGESENYSLNEIIKISTFLDNLKLITDQVNSLSKFT